MVTNNVTVYQFEVGLDEVFADEVRFRVNVDCVIVVVVKDCLFFMSFILCENCEFVKWMCWMQAASFAFSEYHLQVLLLNFNNNNNVHGVQPTG